MVVFLLRLAIGHSSSIPYAQQVALFTRHFRLISQWHGPGQDGLLKNLRAVLAEIINRFQVHPARRLIKKTPTLAGGFCYNTDLSVLRGH